MGQGRSVIFLMSLLYFLMLLCYKHFFSLFCSVLLTVDMESEHCLIWLGIDLSAAEALLLIVGFINLLLFASCGINFEFH